MSNWHKVLTFLKNTEKQAQGWTRMPAPRLFSDWTQLLISGNTSQIFLKILLKKSQGLYSLRLRAFLGAVIKTLAKVSHKYSECSVCTRKENQLLLDLAWIYSPEQLVYFLFPGKVSIGHISYLAEFFYAQCWEEWVKQQKTGGGL